MSDENEQVNRMVREQLDRELGPLALTEGARFRFRRAIGERPAEGGRVRGRRRLPAPRWTVPVVTAAVVMMIGVPGLAVRYLRPATPAAPGIATTVAVPAGPGRPTPTPTRTPSTTVAERPVADPSKPPLAVPSPAVSSVPPRLTLVVVPKLVAGSPVIVQIMASGGTPSTAVAPQTKRQVLDTALTVDLGDGQSGRQQLGCPTGAAGKAQMVADAKHTYRRAGRYTVTVGPIVSACWGKFAALTATITVR